MRIIVQFPTARAEVRDRAWHCPADLDLERELAAEFGLAEAEELTAEVAAIAAKFGGFVVAVDAQVVPVAIGVDDDGDLVVVDAQVVPVVAEAPELEAIPEAPEPVEIEILDPLARAFEDND